MLTEHEKKSPVWEKLKSHIEARMTTHRSRLEGDLSELETAKLRGKLAECREILKIGDDPVIPVKGETGERL